MDETLLKTDVLHEQCLIFLRKNPRRFLSLLIWATRGRAYFKEKITNEVEPDVDMLPLRESVVEIARQCKAQGHRIVLATAGHQRIAEKVADRVGVFDLVLASRFDSNLKGQKKIDLLKEMFPNTSICYVGDSISDLIVWEGCDEVVSINPSRRIELRIERMSQKKRIIRDRQGPIRILIQLVHVRQWAADLLLFTPAVMAAWTVGTNELLDSVLAFFSFSLLASGISIVGDLFRIESDRTNSRRRHSVFAAGELSIRDGVMIVGSLLASSALLALSLPLGFRAVLVIFFMTGVVSVMRENRTLEFRAIDIVVQIAIRVLAGFMAVPETASSFGMTF